MATYKRFPAALFGAVFIAALLSSEAIQDTAAAQPDEALQEHDGPSGVWVILGLPLNFQTEGVPAIDNVDVLVYFQSPDEEEIAAAREVAGDLLGDRIFVNQAGYESIHLADNLADRVLVLASAVDQVAEDEVLRVLNPNGKALFGIEGREITKPRPEGLDPWSHPHHAPDNNPQSTDQLAQAPYLTQFFADPKFAPMPEVTVAGGGRVFRAMGHIAHKKNQNQMLNTLQGINAYNGTVLWQRALPEGFMIHRNTMIATPSALLLGDNESCKILDAATGEIQDEIVVPGDLGDGPVWKWMGLVDGTLYALVGAEEFQPPTQPSNTPGLGHWPWGMWPGHDYANPKTNFGFGRTLIAVNPRTKEILWSHGEDDYLDARGVCMRNGRIYAYSPEKFLACIDAANGETLWKTSDAELLEAIGPEGRAQHYITGYSTQTYIKCNDEYLFFAGSQRSRLVVVRAEDGELLWSKEPGNYQLVLRDDCFYAVGAQDSSGSVKMDYATGEVLAQLPKRRACTRATGSVDSVFFRASGGTVRIDTATNAARHIAPMRPACQDGVIISEGMLFWGPWMCGCQLSLYGSIGLAGAGDFDYQPAMDDSRLLTFVDDTRGVQPFEVRAGDWPCYQANSARTCETAAAVPNKVSRAWQTSLPADAFPTAPVTAGGVVFLGDRNGKVHALDAGDGSVRWRADTAGAVYFPPALDGGRLFVGSADGHVYAFEAATGRPLWRFQAAPAKRWIHTYGKLTSTWPVAGGVVVRDGVVYAAAGIAHYDGAYVYALDAVTGEIKWSNDTSGILSSESESGVSLQGELTIVGDELQFLAGGAYETARYDLATGRCRNEPNANAASRFYTAFYPYYPEYGAYVSLDHTLAEGGILTYDASYEGSFHSGLACLEPLPPGTPKPFKPASRWGVQRRGGPAPKAVWQAKPGRRYNAFIVGPKTLLAAGHVGQKAEKNGSLLAAVNLEDGTERWVQRLPSAVVKAGAAIDADGRIVVSMEDGQIICFSP